jgi:hypothetical protein
MKQVHAGAPKRPSYRLLWISIAVLFASIFVLQTAMAAQDPAADPAVVRSSWQTIGVWVGALLTLGIFSFLYSDNPLYKVCESIFVGTSAAYYMVTAFWTALVPKVIAPLAPVFAKAKLLPEFTPADDYWTSALLIFVPIVLGGMLLMRLLPKGGSISIWTLAFVIGTTAGMRLTASVESDILAQVSAAASPLIVFGQSEDGGRRLDLLASIANIVGIVGVLTVLTYFFFSVEHKGAVGKTARVGIWFLMVTFGASFGLTVMGRITLLSERFEFLLKDWLGIL